MSGAILAVLGVLLNPILIGFVAFIDKKGKFVTPFISLTIMIFLILGLVICGNLIKYL